MTKRSLGIVVLILFFGTLIGTLIGELLGWILPDSVVREFFLRSVEFSLNGLSADESGVILLDFVLAWPLTVVFPRTIHTLSIQVLNQHL